MLRLVGAVLAAAWLRTGEAARKGEALTNIPVDDPENHVLWDEVNNRSVEFWSGNYSDVNTISCRRSGDLLFDWPALQNALSTWLEAAVRGDDRMLQIYWELIRPMQHALTNIVAHHNITTSRDCLLGMLSVRVYYLTVQSGQYRMSEMVEANNFVYDWHYFSQKFSWSNLVRSGWARVIFPSMHLLANSFGVDGTWHDCTHLPGAPELLSVEGEDPPGAVMSSVENFHKLVRVVDSADLESARACPIAFAYAATLVAYGSSETEDALTYLDRAQFFIRQYVEKNDWTFVNILNVQWPIWRIMPDLILRLTEELGVASHQGCKLLLCPDGGTPHPLSCECEHIFPTEHPNATVCLFMVDTRRKSSLRNITSVLNARFWTLAYGINRAYAEDHGYEIFYVQPDNQTHFPERKVGWGKVKVIIDRAREYGPERCAYVVSVDTDAYMRTSEPLAAAIHHYGLDDDKLILFSQEYHTENRPNNTFANGGFFIVRNTAEGIGLLEEWYNVPEDYPEMRHLKKENPQGLNLCWDLKMQPLHSDVVVLAEPHLFTAPLGWFVRHNWFKDMKFEQEMMDVLLQRLQRRYGCIMCQNVYDWDDSVNHDVGWR